MGFGSLGISELVVIFIIVLVFFGPRRFPEIARSMGSAMREFRRSLNQIQRELEEVDPRKDIPGREFLNEIRSGKPSTWLDPDKTRAKGPETPGSRSAPQNTEPPVTGEAGDQLPMFEGPESSGAGPDGAGDSGGSGSKAADGEPPTDDSRSG